MSLFELGYRNVKNYFGGVNRWTHENLKTVKPDRH